MKYVAVDRWPYGRRAAGSLFVAVVIRATNPGNQVAALSRARCAEGGCSDAGVGVDKLGGRRVRQIGAGRATQTRKDAPLGLISAISCPQHLRGGALFRDLAVRIVGLAFVDRSGGGVVRSLWIV